MADIKTKEDWIKSAEATMKQLPEYAAENRRSWDAEAAEKAFKAEDYKTLHYMFEKLWGDLPDSPRIRFGAFFDLCDLCSEYWAVEENA